MKRKTILITLAFMAIMLGLSSCNKRQRIDLSKDSLVFSPMGGMDMISLSADCDWTIKQNDDVNWYSLSQTSGSHDAILIIQVEEYKSYNDRNSSFTIVSANGKIEKTVTITQTRYNIDNLTGRIWFLRFYERWNTDFYDQYIPDSYRAFTYYTNTDDHNWYLYFTNDSIGYQIHTKAGDTVYYAYDYIYYPDGDSLYINYETLSDTVEDYHCHIYQLDNEMFVFSNEYKWHQFEKLTNYNLSDTKIRLNPHPNPKQIRIKPRGPMIQIEP